MKKALLLAMITITLLTVTACSSSNSKKDNSIDHPSSEQTAILEEISAEDAMEMMENEDNVLILDVRTEEEFSEGHIKGAVLIPDYEITEKAEELIKDKSTTILIYCRSGRRSALAAKSLSDLGYTAIYDFGGIIDWPYETVVEE